MVQRRCAKCGMSFGCKADTGGCWCENHVLSIAALKLLREKYDNCLCPACLSVYAEKTNPETEKDIPHNSN